MLYYFYSKQTGRANMSDGNYLKNNSNCIRCGTVKPYGWSLTCAGCQTNEKLDQQNKLLSQQAGAGGGYSDTAPPPWPIYIALLILVAVVVIGFLFFPHWGIVTFVKFLWTLILFFIACFLAVPLFLWDILF